MENTHSFYATLSANVFLNDADFYFIYQCFERHYDHKIKSASEVGGWLYGRKVHRTPYADWKPTDEDRIIDFTFRQIDSVLKSLEMERSEQSSRLNMMFHKIAHEMSITQKLINENMSTYKVENIYVDVKKTK